MTTASASAARLTWIAVLGATAMALGLRLLVAGEAGVRSPEGGLVFAAALAGIAIAARARLGLSPRGAALGLIGGAAICAPAVVAHLARGSSSTSTDQFALWALVVSIVAVSEEAVFRGALFDAVAAGLGVRWALPATTITFALIHVPLYGWHVLPLDLAVGYLLGVLRVMTGSAGAPAIAHTVGDLAGWWLR